MGANAAHNSKFDTTVNMWVFEEMVNGRKLTEIINTDHENVKYLPGHKLPANVVRNLMFLFNVYRHIMLCMRVRLCFLHQSLHIYYLIYTLISVLHQL